ncbi:hypothetical protein MMC19_004772 [Ptychographa xylographoides]|nr:hypothetical protein [Ptychographa xylographoides]
MTPHLASTIEEAFAERPVLGQQISQAIEKDPHLATLFLGISVYVNELQHGAHEEPATKKRRLNGNGSADNGHTQRLPDRSTGGGLESMSALWPSTPMTETSFSVPQRKKLLLQISTKLSEGVRALTPVSQQMEFGIPWRDIEHVVCLPVPEKAQATYNFCVFPKYGDGAPSLPEGRPLHEAMVWTVPDVKAKDVGDEKPNYRKSMTEAVEATGMRVLEPDALEFASEVQQAYRKGEKAYHVKAFRGSKDGFLFFLPTGIAWAFKKPLHFFSHPLISSISYTSVLQRTFNLNIAVQFTADPASRQDFEFSMIDQADFVGIDAYVKRHQLQDASMAEERRAKRLNINGVKGQKAENENDDGETELERAAREAGVGEGDEGPPVAGLGIKGPDEEDDEEDDENFDPGSEGESEGSGTEDEDEEENEDGDGQAEEGDEGEGKGADEEPDDEDDENDEDMK